MSLLVAVVTTVVSLFPRAAPLFGYFTWSIEVVKNGAVQEAALRRSRMSQQELDRELRKRQVELPSLQSVLVEPDGAITLVQSDGVQQDLRRLADAVEALQGEIRELKLGKDY